MEMLSKLALPIVVIAVLVACSPAAAWYKQVAGPSYYSVGRASGLLSGIRRSAYVRREEPNHSDIDESATKDLLSELPVSSSILKTMPVCIKDITPNPQSCEHIQGIKGSFRCKADIIFSLDSSDCEAD